MSYSVQDVMSLGNSDYIRIMKDPVSKIENNDIIKNETEKLLVREKTIFVMNTIVTIGLIITLFQVI
jgi:hypothetical protein